MLQRCYLNKEWRWLYNLKLYQPNDDTVERYCLFIQIYIKMDKIRKENEGDIVKKFTRTPIGRRANGGAIKTYLDLLEKYMDSA